MKISNRLLKIKNSSGTSNCSICNLKTILIDHHINGRKIKDYNKPWNRAAICDNCHRLIHEGNIIVEGWFMTTEGRRLIWYNEGEKSLTDNNSSPYIIKRT
jgi:uncharacterized protein YlaI